MILKHSSMYNLKMNYMGTVSNINYICIKITKAVVTSGLIPAMNVI